MEKRKYGEEAVNLDFGLSSSILSNEFQKAWPYQFELVYSITHNRDSLDTQLQVHNKGGRNFEFQFLTHTYFSVEVGLWNGLGIFLGFLSRGEVPFNIPTNWIWTGCLENSY